MFARLLAFAAVLSCSQAFAQSQLLGFSKAGSDKERSLESSFDGFLNKDNPKAWLERLSGKPHHIGSEYGLQNAQFMLSLFHDWGFDAHIEEFQVLFPKPKERLLELNGDKHFRAKLSEPEVKEDPTSKPVDEQLPPYNAYSADGDVTGKLIYVNYGMPKDYETLEQKGLDVKGKIVIARYGGGWRGLKPKLAAEHGAIGCLIYSDPRDDGFYQGDVFPKGAFRNQNGVQRGSVMDMPVQSGDPLTPNVGATADAKRIPISDAKVIMKIPVTAISYGDALPLLSDLQGEVVPDAWRGALPITYHFGPSEGDVHLKLTFDWTMATARDVIAKLPGSDLPDEWVIRGNHHDAWVTGAQDPLSGAVSLLEEARCVGELTKSGWRPKRTMIYCLWDGEEEGLLGSTEWVETHEQELAEKGSIYINSDTNGRGFIGIEGSHSLESFINEAARDVTDPEKPTMSVAERARARQLVAASGEERAKIRARKDLEIGAMGSGSDFSPFLQHVGVAALNLGFGGENPGGIYHSAYDSFYWYTHYDDKTFDYSNALSKLAGRAMLRFANADVLPFEFDHQASRIDSYLKELIALTDKMRSDTVDENKLIADGTLQATYDPDKTNVVPKPKDAVPYLNFAPLQNAVEHLQRSAKEYSEAYGKFAWSGTPPKVDKSLIDTERAFLTKDGLPGRPWYRHMVYAPGLKTGYGVKTMPGVREAIEERDWKTADQQIPVLAAVIEALASKIHEAAQALK